MLLCVRQLHGQKENRKTALASENFASASCQPNRRRAPGSMCLEKGARRAGAGHLELHQHETAATSPRSIHGQILVDRVEMQVASDAPILDSFRISRWADAN